MQKPEEAAAKTKAQSRAGFRFIMEGRVIQPELAKRFTQLLKIIRIHRVKPAPHHGDGGFEARQSLGCRISIIRDGIANIGISHGFNGGCKIPISPGPRLSIGTSFGVKTPTCSMVCTEPDDIMRMRWPLRKCPSFTRTRMMTPR